MKQVCSKCETPLVECDSDNTLYCCSCNKCIPNAGKMSKKTRKLIVQAKASSESWKKDVGKFLFDSSMKQMNDARAELQAIPC